jgi:hypothetical protein
MTIEPRWFHLPQSERSPPVLPAHRQCPAGRRPPRQSCGTCAPPTPTRNAANSPVSNGTGGPAGATANPSVAAAAGRPSSPPAERTDLPRVGWLPCAILAPFCSRGGSERGRRVAVAVREVGVPRRWPRQVILWVAARLLLGREEGRRDVCRPVGAVRGLRGGGERLSGRTRTGGAEEGSLRRAAELGWRCG